MLAARFEPFDGDGNDSSRPPTEGGFPRADDLSQNGYGLSLSLSKCHECSKRHRSPPLCRTG